MECQVCRGLERAYDTWLSEYIAARASACYQVSKEFAAMKNVEMERSKDDLDEHRLRCVFAGKVLALSTRAGMPLRLSHIAA
jgi:hypothetical protein